MFSRNRFQHNVATGRGLLPVAATLALLVWIVTYRQPTDLLTLGISVAITYILIEMDITFALIRTRTSLPSSLFLFFYAACPFLHTYASTAWIPLLMVAMLFALFRSYESAYASVPIYHSFLCLGIGSFLMPHVLFFLPLLYIQMIGLRSLSLRTFFAGIAGVLTPYWLMGCYYLYQGTLENVYAPLAGLIHFRPIDYSLLSLPQGISAGVFLLVTFVCCIQCLVYSYHDKVQTRIMLRMLIGMGAAAVLLMALQPQHYVALFPTTIFVGSLMVGHLFSLTFNRFTRVFFAISFSLWLLSCLFNIVWMLLYNS